MAKMFYTVEEAADKLGKSTDEMVRMAESGQIQLFRDRERMMFKVEQIDLLAGGGDPHDTGGDEFIGLADTGEQDAIELKEESVLGLADSKESTGISIFDADELETADPSAVTQISETQNMGEFSLDSGAGSGLLDLTREEDDTSLGAVLDDIYPAGEEESDLGGSGSASGFFAGETADAATAGAAAGGMAAGGVAILPQRYDVYEGGWSGMGVGLGIGAVGSLVVALMILLVNTTSATAPDLAETMASNYFMYIGIAAGVTLLLGIIGFFVGRATE